MLRRVEIGQEYRVIDMTQSVHVTPPDLNRTLKHRAYALTSRQAGQDQSLLLRAGWRASSEAGCCPSVGVSVLASLAVSADGAGKPRQRVLAGLWGSGCRGGVHSVVTSVTAARAEDSSTMALPVVNAASRAARAMLLTARG
jgi:hypothetical protein